MNRTRAPEDPTIVQREACRSHALFALLFPTQQLARMPGGDRRAVLETVGNQMLGVSSSILPGRPLRRKSTGTHKEGPTLQSQLYTASWWTRSAACLEQAGYYCKECGIPHGTLERALHAVHSGGLSITPDEGNAGYRWTIGELSGVAVDVLEAISPGLHCLHLDPLEQLERRLA